jgi:hypothetical protein
LAAENEGGAALLTVIAAVVLMLALASALVLTSRVETQIAAASKEDALLLSAADVAASVALLDLRATDWDTVLGGGVTSGFTDGPLVGLRVLDDGTTLDLDRETADLQCGRPDGCSDADVAAVGDERPWGPRNPRWRLFASGPMAMLAPGVSLPPQVYLVAWVADDPSDADDDPFRDGDGADNPGRQVLMVVGRAYGVGGARRTVQLVVERVGTDLRLLARHERHT